MTFDNRSVADNADVLLLAVKPTVVKTVLDQIRPNFSSSRHLLLSVAMGVTVNQLEKVRILLLRYFFLLVAVAIVLLLCDLPCIAVRHMTEISTTEVVIASWLKFF